jgi:uncharacterized ion transporter superfamily protein YfcC
MDSMVLIFLAVALILFVWGWIGIVMVNHINLERRIEKLVNITNRLPEEEREFYRLKELRTVESSKVSSAKWVLILFMLLLIAVMAGLVKYESLRALLGLQTSLQAIWVSVVVLAFFCMPTLMGLFLASSTTKLPEEKEQISSNPKAGAA